MYRIGWDITIGGYRLGLIESVKVISSVDKLSDTATITIPGTVLNSAMQIEDKIRVGDGVSIGFGYDNNIMEEFRGYVSAISTDASKLTIECEDETYRLNKAVRDKAWTDVNVKSIIEYILLETGSGLKLDCSYDFSYDKFTILNANGIDVLRKIQEEASPNIYVKNDTLYVEPKYAKIFGSAIYDFAKNIDKNGCSLEYKRSDDVKVHVQVKGQTSDGKEIKAEAGTTGGEQVNVDYGTSVSNMKSLQLKANELLKSHSYEGYRGNFQSWLVPQVKAGYKVTIRDKDYEYKEGNYYAISVETEISRNGGIRKIELGKKI